MIQEILEYSAIAMGVVGLVLLYLYSISPNTQKSSSTYLYTEQELQERLKTEAKKEKHYKRLSAIGFFLSLLSMLISLWVRFLQ